jgi:hypothetical protein
MASIRELIGKNGKKGYRVQIRKKGHEFISASFDDYETAYIYGKFKESLIEEMALFSSREKMITFKDALVLKFGGDTQTFREVVSYFTDFLDRFIFDVSYEDLKKHGELLLATPVFRGGNKFNNSGKKKLPELNTVLRKFGYMSSAINHTVSQGHDVPNHCLRVSAYLKTWKK